LNDVLYRRHRDEPIADAQAFARRAHAEVLDALHKLADADLHKTVGEFSGDPTDDRPLLNKIAGDTYAHYREHVGWIKELLATI
jgi:hypothetical protein